LVRMHRHIEVIRYLLIGLVPLALSFGATFQPYIWLMNALPGFAVMRAPTRFDFVVMLSLAVLSGFGIARLSSDLSVRSARVRRLLLSAVGVLTLAELLPAPQTLVSVPVGGS